MLRRWLFLCATTCLGTCLGTLPSCDSPPSQPAHAPRGAPRHLDAPSGEQTSAEGGPIDTSAAGSPSARPSRIPSPPKPDLRIASRRLSGELQTTKGYRGMLDGHVISRELLTEILGADWEDQVGNRFEAVADVLVHDCAPMEQCLISGRVPYVESFAWVEREYRGASCTDDLADGAPCHIEGNLCTVSLGTPCGHSSHLRCSAGKWSHFEERNTCP